MHHAHRPLSTSGGGRALFFALTALFAYGAWVPAPAHGQRLELVSAREGVSQIDWRPSPISPEIIASARRRQVELERVGVLDASRSAVAPRFTFPLRQSQRYDDPGFWGAVSYVDHDARFGELMDYNGGDRTYDLEALDYNHQGSDLLVWPFGWVKVARSQVEVIAAAPGRIVEWIDGNFDFECGADFSQERQANVVVIAHEDGSIAIYGHLKRGSLTPKRIGDRVERAEYLGVVGSSGYSGYPHLHFEVFDASNNLIDPYFGPENDTVAESWWQEQPPYYDSRLFTIMTHTAEPTVACNNREWTWAANRFAPGDEVYLVSYLRDFRRGQRLRLWVLDPDGRVVAQEKHRARDPHWAIFLVTSRFSVPPDARPGRWTFRAEFQGLVLEHGFEIGDGEPERTVRTVRPGVLRAGSRRSIKIRGSGFTKDLAIYVSSPVEVDRHVRVVRARIRAKKITLTVAADAAATPGERDIVLTAPDYTQTVLSGAFRVSPR